MGRTVPSFRMLLEGIIEDLSIFKRELRGEDKLAFDGLMNKARKQASSCTVTPILKSYLEPDLFDIYNGHFQEVIDIINEEIDLTEYGDFHSKTVAENVFLKEKLKRVNKIRDESNRQFLNDLKQIDRNETPTPEYIAQCKKMMENPNFAKTISDANNSGFLFYQYVCENILDTFQKYNNTTAKTSFADAPLRPGVKANARYEDSSSGIRLF
jgi:hypothetical protein